MIIKLQSYIMTGRYQYNKFKRYWRKMKKIFFILTATMALSAFLNGSELELYKKACDSGNPAGCYNLGGIYATGKGIKKDLNNAIIFYKKACDGGFQEGCFQLAVLYALKKDNDEAMEIFNNLCDNKFSKGCLIAGVFSEHSKKFTKAKVFYKKACDYGLNEGCENFEILKNKSY